MEPVVGLFCAWQAVCQGPSIVPEHPMTVKVSELAYCRIQLPDLKLAKEFLSDFGLIPAGGDSNRLFFRSTDVHPYCYIVERGPRRFLGWAFHAKREQDLETLAQAFNKPIEGINGPGGGRRVRLQEPNGYDVDIVSGIADAGPLTISRQLLNTGHSPLARPGELYRLERGQATPVKRLAHVVIGSPNVRETSDWFQETLGLLPSDEVVAGPDKTLIGSFIRIDEGDDYVDHHTVFIVRSPVGGLHHISFESQDVDALLADHHHLKSLNRYQHMWGIGRHMLGSQIFDYWTDPFGYLHEHWADTDRLNASTPGNVVDVLEGMITQWGDPTPDRVKHAVQP